MFDKISVIVPNYNGAATAATCLEAILKSDYKNFELIVVDDHSSDVSLPIISQFPCKILRLYTHFGAAYARNMGVRASRGEILFFTDIDCVIAPDTLGNVAKLFEIQGTTIAHSHSIIGGTYTNHSYDKKFFSEFQSAFVHYSESKYLHTPDYVASHSMAIRKGLFQNFGGFNCDLPLLEDVEFSHRLRESGVDLLMDPGLEVQHIFNFSLLGSLRNAIKKSKYWTIYSLDHHDLLTDSGTASYELKINTLAFLISVFVLLTAPITSAWVVWVTLIVVLFINSMVNYRFIAATYRAHSIRFILPALLYYFYVYPIGVIVGTFFGVLQYLVRPIIGRG